MSWWIGCLTFMSEPPVVEGMIWADEEALFGGGALEKAFEMSAQKKEGSWRLQQHKIVVRLFDRHS